LAKRHPCAALEKACEIAVSHRSYRLRTLRTLLKQEGAKQEELPFLEEHPLIRSLADYGALVHQALHQEARP
jgi:hypothetical protein